MNEITRINGLIDDLQQRIDPHKYANVKPPGYWDLVKRLIGFQCQRFKLKNKYAINHL